MFYTFKNFKIVNILAYMRENKTLFFLIFNIYFCIIFTQICMYFDYIFVFVYYIYLLAILIVISLFAFTAHTRLYQLTIVNIVVALRFLLLPYCYTMESDYLLSILLSLIAFFLIYKHKKYVHFLLFVISFNLLMFLIRILTLTIFDGCILCFYTTGFIFYLISLVSILIFKVYFPKHFEQFCSYVNSYCSGSNFGLSLLCVVFGAVLQYHFAFLVTCVESLEFFGLMGSLPIIRNPHYYYRCGVTLDRWCQMFYATQTTYRGVGLLAPEPFKSRFKFLESGIDPALTPAARSQIEEYLRRHPLSHPGILMTETDDVTNEVKSRRFHAVTHGRSANGDRVEIPIKDTTRPPSIMKKRFPVPDEDLTLLQEHKGVHRVVDHLQTIPDTDEKKQIKEDFLKQFEPSDRTLGKAAIEQSEEIKNIHTLDTLKKLKNAKSN